VDVEAVISHSGASLNSNAGGNISMKFDIAGGASTTPLDVYASWGP
jgi:hypothetical protein